MKHRCGGELKPQKVKIRKRIGYSYQNFTVDGYKCDCCGEEIISRDVAYSIDLGIKQLKNLWSQWKVPGETKTTPAYYLPTKMTEPFKLFEDSSHIRSQ